jgi:hypothetical protein
MECGDGRAAARWAFSARSTLDEDDKFMLKEMEIEGISRL